MTPDAQTIMDDARDQLMTYHQGTPKPYTIDIEYHDGSDGRYQAADLHEAWRFIAWLDWRGGFKSAWRDGEPWLGECTDPDAP